MKHILLLSSLLFVACGGSSGGSSAARSSDTDYSAMKAKWRQNDDQFLMDLSETTISTTMVATVIKGRSATGFEDDACVCNASAVLAEDKLIVSPGICTPKQSTQNYLNLCNAFVARFTSLSFKYVPENDSVSVYYSSMYDRTFNH